MDIGRPYLRVRSVTDIFRHYFAIRGIYCEIAYEKEKINGLNIESMQNQQSNLNQQTPQTKKNWKHILVAAFLVATIIGLGISVWYFQYWRTLLKEIKILKQEQEKPPAGWKTYSNQEIGVAFSYPDFWGEVITERTQGPTECAFGQRIVTGTGVSIRFSNNSETNLYFTSPDYKSALCLLNDKGESKEIVYGFTRTCEPHYPSNLNKVFDCKSINIAGSQAISFYTVNNWMQSCGYDGDRNIKFNSPSKNFSGIEIIASVPIGYVSGCDKSGKPDITLEELRDFREGQLKENQLPFDAQQFLWEFDNFIKTIKFI